MNWWQQQKLCAWAILLLSSVQLTTPLIVPQELPSILSLVYSNIPPLKKGTDSRLGFGFRLGEHADFQVVLELGPQKETHPLGDQEGETSFSKRQISRAQQIALLRQQLRQQQQQQQIIQKQQQATETSTERVASSWLEAWSSGMNANKKKTKNPNIASNKQRPMPTKKQQEKTATVAHMPTASTVSEHSLQQLQMLYKMATTTTTTTTDTPFIAAATIPKTTPKPFSGGSLNLGGPAGFTLQTVASEAPSQLLNSLPARKSKEEIAAELMDVSLDGTQR